MKIKRFTFIAIFMFIICIGLGIRLYYALLSPYNINADTSTIGLMALHILRGKIPLFFYGMAHQGPFESLIIALFFIISGISNYTMFYTMLFFSFLFLISTYYLARKFGDRIGGIVALLYCAIPPYYLLWTNMLPRGYQVETLFVGNILFILTLRMAQRKQEDEGPWCYIIMGLIAGFSFWTHYIMAYYLFPIIFFLVINKRWKTLLKFGPLGIGSFFLGGLPLWLYTFTHSFETFKFPTSDKSKVFLVIKDAFLKNFLALMELRPLHISKGQYLDCIVTIIYLFSFLYFLWVGIRQRSRYLLRLHENFLLIFLFLTIVILCVIFNYHSLRVGCAYYLLPIYTIIPVTLGAMVNYTRGRFRIYSIICFIFILLFNAFGDYRGFLVDKERLSFKDEYFTNYINFLRKNRIDRIICNKREDFSIQFLTNEEIIMGGFCGSLYYPNDFIIDSSDKVAIDTVNNAFEYVVEMLCNDYKEKNGLYYDIAPNGYVMKEINPKNWHIDSNYNLSRARYAFDRNYNRWWVTDIPRKTGMYFTVDLGKVYTICKFQIFNANHYHNLPVSSRVEISIDGGNWRVVGTLPCSELMFWSGPRLYQSRIDGRWEVIFSPVSARYIRLVQIGDDEKHPWEINELFVYEFLGKGDNKVRDYVKDAKGIFHFIDGRRFRFVYADFWLSAKLRKFSEGSIGVLERVNEVSAGVSQKNISRDVRIAPDVAFVVPRENEESFEKMVKEFSLPIVKHRFNIYTCYFFREWDSSYLSNLDIKPWLYWIGIGMVKGDLRNYSELMLELGQRSEVKQDYQVAEGFYRKAIGYYPNNFRAYIYLIKLYRKMGDDVSYLKWAGIFRHRFIPRFRRDVIFSNGVELLGYSINSRRFRPCGLIKVDYFWRVDSAKGIDSDTAVFVHFLHGKDIVFQNDHVLLGRFRRPLSDWIYKETFILRIPKDAPLGNYQIYIGLWNPKTGKRFYINDGKHRSSFKLGSIGVVAI